MSVRARAWDKIVLAKFKPATTRKTKLLFAAIFWALVGSILLLRGASLLVSGEHYLFLAGGLILGTVKATMVFERSARKNIKRILRQKEGTCLGAVFTFKAWGVVLAMILMGRFLRHLGLPVQVYGGVVVAVGWGLLWASRLIWQEWIA